MKDILADKMTYLKGHFSTEAVSRSVVDAITKADGGGVNFARIVFTIVPHFIKSQSATPAPDYRFTLTYVSIGGPFVDTLDELSSNGFPASQTYSLTYRGVLLLDTQYVALSEHDARPSSVMKNLKVFSPLNPAATGSGEFEWRYQMAPHIQIMNFMDTYFHCTYGTAYPASQVNARLKGDAQDLDCEARNDNNIVTGHSTIALLQYYGVGLTRARSTAASTVEFGVEDVQID
ncbi:MAG TPA: hypothetical protein VMT49_02780 [Steroidobacteraceae bacterium]|nr:hypothetical protein [Steroidobacteraceae bacterium]